MQANLVRIFEERDAVRRLAAVRELYAPEAVLNEPESSAHGHEARNWTIRPRDRRRAGTNAFDGAHRAQDTLIKRMLRDFDRDRLERSRSDRTCIDD
jgi:hypothetical protein